MKKYIFAPITLLMIFLFNSCQQNQIFLTGTIEGSDSTVVAISGFIYQDNPDTIKVKDGKFSHKIEIDHPGYYNFIFGDEEKMIFLAPGYQLNIAIQVTDTITNYTFQGKGDLENHTLEKIIKELDKMDNSFLDYPSTEKQIKHVDSLFNAFQLNFADTVKHKKIDPIFVNFQKKYFEFNNALFKTYIGLQKEVKDPNFYKYMESLEMNNCQYLGIPSFRYYLDYQLEYQLDQKLSKLDSIKRAIEIKNSSSKFEVIKTYENKKIREYLMFNLLKQVIEYEGIDGFKKVKIYYDEYVKDEKFRDYIHIQLNKKQLIAKGKPAFNFVGIDVNEKEVTLQDLRGSVLFVDFWATWCNPCRAEAPYNTALSKEYKGKGIQFVSISIDDEKNIEKWKTMIKEDKNILHLRVSKEKRKELIEAFQIKGIPTYMLIDQNGNFINSTAPRPSSLEIRQEIDKLIVK